MAHANFAALIGYRASIAHRRAIVLGVFLWCIAGTSLWGQLERVSPEVEVPSVSVAELASAVEQEGATVLIDVRLEEDFEADPVLIPEASWRDPNGIESWAEELDPKSPVVVYCVRGHWVSQSVTKKLLDLGFDVSQLEGGIEAWKADDRTTAPADKR